MLRLGDDGANMLANLIQDVQVLTNLILFNNNIEDEGCQALAAALKSTSCLSLLDLSIK